MELFAPVEEDLEENSAVLRKEDNSFGGLGEGAALDEFVAVAILSKLLLQYCSSRRENDLKGKPLVRLWIGTSLLLLCRAMTEEEYNNMLMIRGRI